MRPGIEVRPIRPGDVDGLVGLCLTARRESWAGPQVCSTDPATLAHQIGTVTGVPGATVLLALAGQDVVGLLLGRTIEPNLFTDQASFAVEAVYVDPKQRRRGVGHALMLAAVETALEAGADQVFAAPIPGARGMQRFFVRLGFTAAAAYRVIGTSALHRHLTAENRPRRQGPRGLEDLIARRRQSRDGTSPGQVQAGPVQDSEREAMSRQVSRAVQTRLEPESSTTIS